MVIVSISPRITSLEFGKIVQIRTSLISRNFSSDLITLSVLLSDSNSKVFTEGYSATS